jgi:quercetin dioxygenase-like cupin family protein
VSPSAISKIETDKYRPSVSTLFAIVTELGISLDELFASGQLERETAGEAGTPRAHRSGDAASRGKRLQPATSRKTIRLDSGVSWERLTASSDPEADFVLVKYDVGGSSSANDTFMRHAGREYGIVLSGRLEVTVGFETYVLGPGDSISFESTTPHRLRNVSDEPVTGIWFVIGRQARDAPRGER